MTRNEFEDRLNYCRRELVFLLEQKINCTTCSLFVRDAKVCQRFGQVPDDFIEKGCDEWDFDDVPF